MSDVSTTTPTSFNNEEDKRTGRADDAAKLDIKNLPDLLTVRSG